MSINSLSVHLHRARVHNLGIAELVSLIDSFNRDGERVSSEELYKVWIEYNSDNSGIYMIYFNYAIFLTQKDEYFNLADRTMARDLLHKAVKHNDGFFQAYLLLGDIYEYLGESDEAIKYWGFCEKSALEVHGNQSDAIKYIIHAQDRINRISLQILQPTTWIPTVTKKSKDIALILTDKRAIAAGLWQ